MTHRQNLTSIRFLPAVALAALIGSACGTTTSSPVDTDQAPAEEIALDAPDPSSTDAPTTTAAPLETPSDPPAPQPETDDVVVTTAPVTCGEFGPIPPVPDSMPTLSFDTDGDGEADDEVTAYGAATWVLRIVENGNISEAAMPAIQGWAFISNDYDVDGRDFIEVTDNDLGTIYTFATVDGCVELLDTRDPIDDLAAPTPEPDPDPDPTGPSDALAAPGACGTFGAIPANASIASHLIVDLAGDGSANDEVVSYFDGTWTLRTVVAGVASEIDISGVGAGSVRALGLANVGELTAGSEIIATTGSGSSAALIGVFGLDGSDCVFRFADASGDPMAMSAGSSIGNGSQFFCDTGYVGGSAWDLHDDGTYDAYGAAFVESTPGQFTYMPSSDYFDEGVGIDELPTDIFDCNGLTL